MPRKSYPGNAWKTRFAFIILLLLVQYQSVAQVYFHNFGTTPIASHPYTVAPSVSDPHFTNSSWGNSLNAWTSNTGATGEAIRLTSTASATITLTFDIAANFQADITSFDFWRQRSNLGPQNWSMTINGISVGSGTIGLTGANIGNTLVSNPVSGLTGTVTVLIALSGNGGNGTFRLDDFTLNGSVTSTCTAATITSFSPLSGPQNTLVSIMGSGFQLGSGTSSVKFNGVNASFNVVSDNLIKAYIPAGNATGNVSVTTDGCEGFAATPFTELISASVTNYSSDIYISEIYDAQAGDGGVIEIYNGTQFPVNLSGYTIRRYGDIGGSTFYTINLAGTIPPGGIFLVGIGTGTTPCAITENQHYSTGFNSNDEFELYHNSVLIDNVHAPTGVGYSVIRNPNAIGPNPVFNSSDWGTWTTENCAGIGIHNVITNTPPPVTSPVSNIICETNAVVFTASIANPGGYTFQWKTLNASGVWVNVNNVAPYSGAYSGTLAINPAPASFNDNQYYCQMTSAVNTVVSNAAQLEVNPVVIPDFPTALTICSGDTVPALNTVSPNGIAGTWNPATIDNLNSGNYIFTPNAGQCAANATLTVTVNNIIISDFATALTICSGDTVPALNTVSPNGITGTWNPATIDNLNSGSYIFTPNAGQCAANATLTVTVNTIIIPNFATALTICSGDTVPALNTVSPNGISGTWNPSTIDNLNSGNYIFTPNPGQCAHTVTLAVTVTNQVIPDFVTTLTLCDGAAAPGLNPVSPNGITGTWHPSTIDNLNDGSYIFTPNSGQCATTVTLTVTVDALIDPDFATALTICSGEIVPALNATSPNGIAGAWNPSIINNTASGSYVFTPAPGQCADSVTLNVTVNATMAPDFAAALNLCHGEIAPILNTVSPNGISGTWNPATISNTVSGTYAFTPNPGQCANSIVLNVTIANPVMPNFATALTFCSNQTMPALNPVSPNGISGTWNPAAIDNTTGGSYVFTPNGGQCANSTTLNVTIESPLMPNFVSALTFCSTDAMPVLQTTSPNGISGTWTPSVVNHTGSGNYIFTPNPGQCAAAFTLSVVITNAITPNFATVLSLCQGEITPVLEATAPNGIAGTWNPATISNHANGTYYFTPNPGQCANPLTLTVTVNPLPQPLLQDAFLCMDHATGQILNPVTLYCGIPNANHSFSWTLDGQPLPTATNTHLATEAGLYEVTVTNPATGCMAEAACHVNISSMAVATVTGGQDFNSQTLTVHVSGGSGHYQFQLDGGLPQDSHVFRNVAAGDHVITVIDINGCNPLILPVTVLDYPHYFTPNGDGFHDYWNIAGLSGQPQARIHIFDRYGKLLKTLQPSDRDGWDGTYNGNTLPSTDYWFTLFYFDSQNQAAAFKAHFSLKR